MVENTSPGSSKNIAPSHGIRHEKTVLGTPEHNGVVERMNLTIVENVWCMLCKTREKSNFSEKWQNGNLMLQYKLKTWKFFRSQMMKRTSLLDSSCKI